MKAPSVLVRSASLKLNRPKCARTPANSSVRSPSIITPKKTAHRPYCLIKSSISIVSIVSIYAPLQPRDEVGRDCYASGVKILDAPRHRKHMPYDIFRISYGTCSFPHLNVLPGLAKSWIEAPLKLTASSTGVIVRRG